MLKRRKVRRKFAAISIWTLCFLDPLNSVLISGKDQRVAIDRLLKCYVLISINVDNNSRLNSPGFTAQRKLLSYSSSMRFLTEVNKILPVDCKCWCVFICIFTITAVKMHVTWYLKGGFRVTYLKGIHVQKQLFYQFIHCCRTRTFLICCLRKLSTSVSRYFFLLFESKR